MHDPQAAAMGTFYGFLVELKERKIFVGELFHLQVLHATRGGTDSDWRKPAGLDQDLSELDAIVCIDVEDLNSGGSTLRFTHKDGPYPAEMAVPLLFTKVKQGHGFVMQSP